MSHRDDSSNDETASAGEQSTQVLQSHFDHGGNATRPADGMLMETQSRRRRSVKMASIFFESRIISSEKGL